jgi:hypothetical protein
MSPKVLSPLSIPKDITDEQAKEFFKTTRPKTTVEDEPSILPEARENLGKENIFYSSRTVNSDASNSSMDHFFPEKGKETQSEFIQGSSKDNITKTDQGIESATKTKSALDNANVTKEEKTSWLDALKGITKRKAEQETPEVSEVDLVNPLEDILNPDIIVDNPSESDKLKKLEVLKGIKSQRKEYGTPQISNVGLQTSVEDKLGTSPLNRMASFSNQFEDTMGLFDEETRDPGIDTSGDSSNIEETQVAQITEIVKGPINPWTTVVAGVTENNPRTAIINLNKIKDEKNFSILTLTTDGVQNLRTIKSTSGSTLMFDWDNRPDSELENVKLKSIIIIDDKNNSHNVYSNDDVISSNFYTNLDKTQEQTDNVIDPRKMPSFTNLFSQLTGRNNTQEDTLSSDSSSEVDTDHIINWNEEITFNIHRGKTEDRFIDFNLGNNYDKITRIQIILNDGNTQYFNPHTSSNDSIKSIKWDNFGSSNPNNKDLDIYQINIMDNIRSTGFTSIYTNPNPKFLDSWKENIRL